VKTFQALIDRSLIRSLFKYFKFESSNCDSRIKGRGSPLVCLRASESPFGRRGDLRANQSPLSVVAVQLEELDGGRVSELDAELAGDLTQGVVEVREVIDGHVANEGAANFVVAGAAVQPAKKEEQLEARGEADDDPVGIHKCV
jgi:hypothetical protein